MKSYNFPFNTCEKNRKGMIAQPYSASLNLITSLIIFYFLLQVKNFKNRIVVYFFSLI